MPRIILLFGGLISLLIVLLILGAVFAPKKASNPTSGVDTNIPVSSGIPQASAPSLDNSPAPVQNPQTFSVSSTSINNGDANIPLDSSLTFTFNRNFDSSKTQIKFTPDAKFTVSSGSNTIILTPDSPLSPATQYTVEINIPNLDYTYSLTFTTVTASPSPSPNQ